MWKSVLAAAGLLGLVSGPANAAVVINAFEQSGNVVFEGSGSLDLTDIALAPEEFTNTAAINPNVGFISNTNQGMDDDIDDILFYVLSFETDVDFGAIDVSVPTSVSGDAFSINSGRIGLPFDYVSGGALAFGLVFEGATFASLSMLEGTYSYLLPNDTVTLNIGPVSTVPLPAALPLMAAAIGGLGLLSWRRRNSAA